MHPSNVPAAPQAAPAHADAPGHVPPGRRAWWTLALLSAAQFMLIVDVTVVNVALPSIGRSLALDRVQLTWIMAAYTLLFGGLLVLGGRLADAFGRRRMFLTGLGLFVLASLGSALAPSGSVLIGSRALQGVAASLLSPAALSLVTTTFQGPARMRALAVWAALGGLGAAAGVILGGVLSSGPGWQWIFLVNVPIGVAVGLGIWRLVPATMAPASRAGLDVPGGIAFALAIGSLLWAVIDAGSTGWTSPSTLARFGVALVLFLLFAWRELTTPEPLVRLGMLADRRFSGPVALMLTGSVVLGGMIFLASLYLQLVLGLPAVQAGLLFLPMAGAIMGGSQWAARFIGHHGHRGASVAGFLAASVGLLYLSRLPATGILPMQVVPGLAVTAFGIGAVFVSASTAALGRVADDEAGLASGFLNTSHEVGLALGAAVASTIGGTALLAGPAVGASGFAQAFLAAVAVALVGALGAAVLMPATAPHTAGRRIFAH